MNKTEAANNLFESIDVIVDRKLQQLSFDRCVLMKVVKATGNKYTLKYQDYLQEAYAINGYKQYAAGDMVWVLIPQNSFKEEKFILGQVDYYYKEDAPAQIQELFTQISELQNQVKDLQTQLAALQQR